MKCPPSLDVALKVAFVRETPITLAALESELEKLPVPSLGHRLLSALVENARETRLWRSVPRCEYAPGLGDPCGEIATYKIEYEAHTSHSYTVREKRCGAHSKDYKDRVPLEETP